MHGDLFIRILNISITSCYTIVAVMVIRALLLKWERKYAYLLWFVVFVNLCIPFRISGPFSLVPSWIADFDITGADFRPGVSEKYSNYIPREEIVETHSVHSYTPEEAGGVTGTDVNSESVYVPGEFEQSIAYLPAEEIVETHSVHSYTSGEADGVPGTDINTETTYYINDGIGSVSLKQVLAFVWGIGVAVFLAWNIKRILKFRGSLKAADVFLADGVAESVDIKTVRGIETPFLWGFLSPVIYLPENMNEDERTYIIAHESYHRKRKDYLVKPLFFAITVIHWFNPLVWAAYLLFVRDMEISCDEAAIANADADIRKKYAASLLKYAARQNGYTLTPITFGEPSLKCRIKNVLGYREKSVIISVLALCVVIVVMAGLIFKPQQKIKVVVLSDNQEESQILDETPIRNVPIADNAVGKEETTASNAETEQEIKWKSGKMIKGLDGENMYTKILTESDSVSGKASAFRTFVYNEAGDNETGDNETDPIAYVIAGEIQEEAITGSLWLVKTETGVVQPVMQNIMMTDTQIASLTYGDEVYVIINYLIENHTDGRILPITTNALSTELMADISGEKRIGDAEGTIICGNHTYLIDTGMPEGTQGYDNSQDEKDWNPEVTYKRGDKTNHYQVGQEYELTDEEQMRLDGLVPYYGDDMDSFFHYCDATVTTVGNARRRSAYAWINQIGRTESFDVYGTNLIDTMLIRTPDEKYLRIDHTFSSTYNEVPFLCEADFDADGDQELVMMGGFGLHGTGIYQEQLFIADKGADGIWRAYELHEDIYLPMIDQHIGSVYSEEGLELQIDGKGVGFHFAYDGVDDSATYGAGAQIRFGYGESGIVDPFASEKNRMIGSRDNPDKKIVLDALLGVYSDHVVSGIFPGNHFVAALTYEGDGAWSLSEYHHEFLY